MNVYNKIHAPVNNNINRIKCMCKFRQNMQTNNNESWWVDKQDIVHFVTLVQTVYHLIQMPKYNNNTYSSSALFTSLSNGLLNKTHSLVIV